MINKGERRTINGIRTALRTAELTLTDLAVDPQSPPVVRAEVAATAGRLNALQQMLDDLIEGGNR